MTLLELEKLRKQTKLFLILTIVVLVIAAPFWPSIFSIVLTIAAALFFLFAVLKKMTDYKKHFKNNIVRASLDGIFTELNYEPDKGVSAEEVENSHLVTLRNEFVSNDLIAATYGKVKFKQADIIISDKSKLVGTDGIPNEVTSVCFTGRFLVFDFLKETTAPVIVMGKNYNPDGNRQGVMGTLKNKFVKNKNGEQVYMESQTFNDNFKVYSSDPETAFYILTPQIIEAISMLSKQYEDKIALCFQDNKMFVAIVSKTDSLEAKILSNRTIWNEQELVLKDIKVITDFIELMNLEHNTLVIPAN